MINSFYNLKKFPFQKDIKPKDVFRSPAIHELYSRLDFIKQNRGFMLITGNPGTGKSLHIRCFLESLNPNLFKPIYIPLSTITPMDFHRQLCFALSGFSFWKKSLLFEAIQNSIKDLVLNYKKIPIIIFDEAHFLKNENFFELQIISNFNIDSSDPAIFILIAQPHLSPRLQCPVLSSFYQRIFLKFRIPPFSNDETASYISHHLSLAGATVPIFSQNALSAIHQFSGGIPRIINDLALKTLSIGALEQKTALSEEDVLSASHEL